MRKELKNLIGDGVKMVVTPEILELLHEAFDKVGMGCIVLFGSRSNYLYIFINKIGSITYYDNLNVYIEHSYKPICPILFINKLKELER